MGLKYVHCNNCKITILCTDDGIKSEKLMQNTF